MNLPNALTIGRILVAPLIAALPFISSPAVRFAAFIIYLAAAASDYLDGMLARTRNMVTDLGKLLDPLADKLLLFATLIPMFVLMSPPDEPFAPDPEAFGAAHTFPFITPFGNVWLPWWVVVIVLGRELIMTVFRQLAARRGVVIGAIGPAKLKTVLQSVWVGSAYFWFFAATLAAANTWDNGAWRSFAYVNAAVGISSMVSAVFLTVYSLLVYVKRYARVFGDPP